MVEKNDFASGTSSKSSKLMHGGIRYLEQFQFHLIREALRERWIHLQQVPQRVQPLAFIIPVYEGDRRTLWMMKLGVLLYDWLAGKYKVGKHEFLSRQAVLERLPGLRPEGLKGGVLYYDAQMDDRALVLDHVHAARDCGAAVLDHTEVTAFIKENGRVTGAAVRRPSGETFEIHARKIIAAVGPWSNQLVHIDDTSSSDVVRLTKGVHLIYPARLAKEALLVAARHDRRIFFIIPWRESETLIGTTDTDFRENPDQVSVEEKDISYLLEETRRIFPGIRLEERSHIATFAGLRPLLRHEGAPSRVSREHSILETASGLILVIGGKYTTYRVMARDALRHAFGIKHLPDEIFSKNQRS